MGKNDSVLAQLVDGCTRRRQESRLGRVRARRVSATPLSPYVISWTRLLPKVHVSVFTLGIH